MPYRWPEETDFATWELDVLDRACSACGRTMYVCDHRHHHIFCLDGPAHLVCKLNHCPDPRCPGHHRTVSPEAEATITMPYWVLGWDVFCWIGHRRFARRWSVPQIRGELLDSYNIPLSSDAIEKYLRRYQTMLAARQQDPERLRQEYRSVESLILSIDGLQPEKGHETLYVVRELTTKRVWFAEALLSATASEVQRLIIQARQWAEQLGKPVKLWVSDKQDASVTGIATEFPDVPHRYCVNHFLRDLAKPVLEADSHAEVQMRKKVRGLRSIEKAVLDQRWPRSDDPQVVPPPRLPEGVGEVVLDYCCAVRGILNDDQGGPLHPPGLRMAEALGEVRQSLGRNPGAKRGDTANRS
jgi:hypothetical protein